MVPVVVYGVDELHKGNQVPGEDEHARFVQLDVRHGVVLRGWYMVTPFNPNQLLSFVFAYVSLSLSLWQCCRQRHRASAFVSVVLCVSIFGAPKVTQNDGTQYNLTAVSLVSLIDAGRKNAADEGFVVLLVVILAVSIGKHFHSSSWVVSQ